MSAYKEGVLRLLALLVLVLANLGMWGVDMPLGVFIALQVGAAAWVAVVLVEWIRGDR